MHALIQTSPSFKLLGVCKDKSILIEERYELYRSLPNSELSKYSYTIEETQEIGDLDQTTRRFLQVEEG